jgi:hypothetical protein
MLETVKDIGLFFADSPKRCRRLEEAIDEANINLSAYGFPVIPKSKLKLFCQSWWSAKHTVMEDCDIMYEPLLICLEAIGSIERNWKAKSMTGAYGLHRKLCDPVCIVCFK